MANRLNDAQLIIKLGELGLDGTTGQAVLGMLTESWRNGYNRCLADVQSAQARALEHAAKANLTDTLAISQRVVRRRHGR